MKEVIFEEKTYKQLCPNCGADVRDHCGTYKNVIETIDHESIKDGKYGVQCRWKEVYICPHCGEKFYCVFEH